MNSYDFLNYLTVYLEGSEDGDTSTGFNLSATGFYTVVDIDGKQEPAIVTAGHFAEKTPLTHFTLHSNSEGEILTLPLIMNADWITSDGCDLAYCKLSDIEEEFKKIYGKKLFYTSISKENILSEREKQSIPVLSEVVTVGYPLRLYNTHNRYPLFFKGHLSTPPKDNYENKIGYVDMSANNGLSGSPILLNNSVPKLVGILTSTVCSGKNPTDNLCTYVDAQRLFEFNNKFVINIKP